jgi:hypothetical protein
MRCAVRLATVPGIGASGKGCWGPVAVPAHDQRLPEGQADVLAVVQSPRLVPTRVLSNTAAPVRPVEAVGVPAGQFLNPRTSHAFLLRRPLRDDPHSPHDGDAAPMPAFARW